MMGGRMTEEDTGTTSDECVTEHNDCYGKEDSTVAGCKDDRCSAPPVDKRFNVQ